MFKGSAKVSEVPPDVAADLCSLQKAGHLTAEEAQAVVHGVRSVQRAMADHTPIAPHP